ncbi:MFS transporter [Terrimonas pollutisoli]|uniref:MFS transporter n=1 Tax=Terrimonas pollutisoli TaxID=3034147 RepID=UPI0023EDAD91|nr:MFS transporter [Terrimonas sp. H1YJ31]
MDDNPTTTQVTNDPFAAVRIPEYKNLVLGRFCFIMALRMMSTLVGWWIYELTNDPFAIGLIGLSEVIPALSMALYSGHVIDISEKRRLLLKSVFGYICAAAVLLFLTTPFIHHRVDKVHISYCIYGVIFCTGIIRSFAGPSFSALIATIVPRQFLQNATTWSQGSWLSASVTGHAMGGFLIAFIGTMGTQIVIFCLLIIAFFILTQLKPKPALQQSGEKRTWESVKEGVKFVFRTKELLAALSLDMFAVLFGGAVAMVPVYARDILKIGPIGFGWLNAAIDIGAIVVVVLLTIAPMKRAQGRKLLFAVAGFGICIILFALSKWFILSFLALMIAGMLDGISVVVRGTVMQLKTPDHMRGRVSSVSSMFINSSNELGQFESGLAARILGVVPSVVFGGCMTLAVVVTTWIKAPTLRKFEY